MKTTFTIAAIGCVLLAPAVASASDVHAYNTGWYDFSVSPAFGHGFGCGGQDLVINDFQGPNPYGVDFLTCICGDTSTGMGAPPGTPVPLGNPGNYSTGAPIPSGVIQHSTLAAATNPASGTTAYGAYAASTDGNLYVTNIDSDPCNTDPTNASISWSLVGPLPTTSVLGLAYFPGSFTTATLYALGSDWNVYNYVYATDTWQSAGLQNVASIGYSPSMGAISATLYTGETFFATSPGQWTAAFYPPDGVFSPFCVNQELAWDSTQDCVMAVGGALAGWWFANSQTHNEFAQYNGSFWGTDDTISQLFDSNGSYSLPPNASYPPAAVIAVDPRLGATESWQALVEGGPSAPFGDLYFVISNHFQLHSFSD